MRVALHTRLKAGKESEYEPVQLAEPLDVEDDYPGTDTGLALVWELP